MNTPSALTGRHPLKEGNFPSTLWGERDRVRGLVININNMEMIW